MHAHSESEIHYNLLEMRENEEWWLWRPFALSFIQVSCLFFTETPPFKERSLCFTTTRIAADTLRLILNLLKGNHATGTTIQETWTFKIRRKTTATSETHSSENLTFLSH